MSDSELLTRIAADVATLAERSTNFVTKEDFTRLQEQVVTHDDLKRARSMVLTRAISLATLIATIIGVIVGSYVAGT